MLHLDGWAVRTLPCARRRELLAELELDRSSACGIPRHFVGQNESVLRLTAQMELEGVVAKRLDSPYWEGRRCLEDELGATAITHDRAVDQPER